MIETKNITIDGKVFKQTTSVLKDFRGIVLKEPYFYIQKKGSFEVYDKAIDPIDSTYEYEEIDKEVEDVDDSNQE